MICVILTTMNQLKMQKFIHYCGTFRGVSLSLAGNNNHRSSKKIALLNWDENLFILLILCTLYFA